MIRVTILDIVPYQAEVRDLVRVGARDGIPDQFDCRSSVYGYVPLTGNDPGAKPHV